MLALSALLAVGGCSSASTGNAGGTPAITPDYSGITVPCNIAPLTFRVDGATKCVATFTAADGSSFKVSGRDIRPGRRQWRKLLEASAGSGYDVQVRARIGGNWVDLEKISNSVAEEPVDEFIFYRLIEPTYGMAGEMSIEQRNLTSYATRTVFNNLMDFERGGKGQCINCHSFQNYRTDRMQFHVRQHDGGTIIVRDGKPMKVNLKAEGLLSPGVYPSWHPTEELIAYSVNKTNQYFFSTGEHKTEVVDSASDIMLYDPEKSTVSLISADSTLFETFPYWSADGKALYYACADASGIALDNTGHVSDDYDKVHYNLMKIPFDAETRSFGEPRIVFDAVSAGMSATFPRESPDGRYLLFTVGDFGQFHIWHKNADLWLMDLSSGDASRLDEVCSDDAESYHSWSSNGRWIIFSSRRGDNTYTRLYLAYFDADGNAHKAFVIPQKNPSHYGKLFKSFNIPEFTVEPMRVRPKKLLHAVNGEAVQAVAE